MKQLAMFTDVKKLLALKASSNKKILSGNNKGEESGMVSERAFLNPNDWFGANERFVDYLVVHFYRLPRTVLCCSEYHIPM